MRLNLLIDLHRPCEVAIITSAEFVEYERMLVAILNKGPLAQTAVSASAKLQCHKMLRPEIFNVETPIEPALLPDIIATIGCASSQIVGNTYFWALAVPNANVTDRSRP